MTTKQWILATVVVFSVGGFVLGADNELPPEIQQELAQWHGTVTKEFALVASVPSERFAALNASFGAAGYQPSRIRPYKVKQDVLISAVWTRTGSETKVVFDLTAAAAQKEVEDQRQAGFSPIDVSGYVANVAGHASTRHVVVFEKVVRRTVARTYFEVPSGQHGKMLEDLRNSGLAPRAISLCQDAKDALFVDGLWAPPAKRWRFHWDHEPPHRAVMTEVAADYEQVDITVSAYVREKEPKNEWQSTRALLDVLLKDPKNLPAGYESFFLSRGRLAFCLGDDAAAIADLSEYLKREPKGSREVAIQFRAMARARSGERFDDDLKDFAQLAKHSGQTNCLQAAVIGLSGKRSEARKLLEQEIAAPKAGEAAPLASLLKVAAILCADSSKTDVDLADRFAAIAVDQVRDALKIRPEYFADLAQWDEWKLAADHPRFQALRSQCGYDRMIGGVWQEQGDWQSLALHGLSPEQQADKTAELMGAGWQPVAVRPAALRGNVVTFSSLWKRNWHPDVLTARSLHEKANKLSARSDDAEVLGLYRQVVDLRKKHLDSNHPHLRNALRDEALFLERLNRPYEAAQRNLEALRTATDPGGKELLPRWQADIDDLMEKAVSESIRRDDFEKAANRTRQWIDLGVTHFGKDHWRTRNAEACLLTLQALRAGPEDARAGVVKAISLLEQGRLAKDIPALTQALELLSKHVSPENVMTLAARYQLGLAHTLQKNHEKALEAYAPLIAHHRALGNRDDPLAGLALHATGIALAWKDDFPASIDRLSEATAVLRKAFGESHTNTRAALTHLSQVLTNFAKHCANAHDHAKACAAWESVEREGRLIYGENAPEVRYASWQKQFQSQLGSLAKADLDRCHAAISEAARVKELGRQKNYQEASKLADEVRAELERLAGPESPPVLELSTDRGHFQFQLRRIDEAIAIYERVFAAFSKHLEHEHSETNEAAESLLYALKYKAKEDWQTLRLAEAEQTRSRIWEITQLIRPQTDWQIAEAQAELADATQAAKLSEADVQKLGKAQALLREVAAADAEGQFASALEKSGEALAIYGRVLGTEHGAYGTALRWMARLFQRRSTPERATSLIVEEAARIARRYGNAHPTTAERHVELGDLLLTLGDHSRAIDPLTRAAAAYRGLPLHKDEFNGVLESLAQAMEANREGLFRANDCRSAAATSDDLAAVLAERYGEDNWRVFDARLLQSYFQDLAADPQRMKWALEAETLLKQAAEKSAAGENATALTLAQQAEAMARKVSPVGNQAIGSALFWQAKLLADQKRFAESKSVYEAAATEYAKLYDAAHPSFLRLQQHRAALDEALGQWEAARNRLRQAFEVANRLPKTESARQEVGEALLRILSPLAAREAKAENFAQAIAAQEEAAHLASQLYGGTDERTSNLVLQLDYFALMQDASVDRRKRLKEAEGLRDDAWEKYTQGNLAGAIEGYQKSRALFLAELGNDHHYVASVEHALGWMSQLNGDNGTAELMLHEALAARERSLPREHVDRAHSLDQLGWLLHRTSRLDEAEAKYTEALALFHKLKGSGRTETASCLNHLGLLARDKGDLNRAEKLIREAREIWVQNYGETHPEVAVLDNNLGLLAQANGQFGAALTLFNRAMTVLRDSPPQWQGMYALTLCNLAELHLTRQSPEQAEKLLIESLKVRRRLFAADHPEVVHTDLLLARTYAELKRPRLISVDADLLVDRTGKNGSKLSEPAASDEAYHAAIERFRSDFAARRKALGDNHPIAIGSRNTLILLLDRAGSWYATEDDYDKAAQAYRELEGMLVGALGQDHFRTVAIRLWAESYERTSNVSAEQQAVLRTARANVRKARQLQAAGQSAAALTLLLEAHVTIDALLGADTLETVVLISQLAQVELELGHFEAAIKHNALALQQQEQLAGRRDRICAAILHDMGYCHFQLANHAEAESRYREAVATLRDLRLTTDKLYANAVRGLAGVYHHTWNNGQAREILASEIGRIRLVFGEDSEEHAEFLDLLASVDRDLGDFRSAIDEIRQAIAIRSQKYGPQHAYTIDSLNSLGQTYSKGGYLGEAESTLREVLKRRIESLGAQAALVQNTRGQLNSLLTDIANRLFDRENYTLSAKYWSEVHSLRESLYGAKDWKTANARTGLSRAKACAALNQEGRERFTRARGLAAEVRRLDKLGRHPEALAAAQRVIADYGELLGKDHPDVALEYDMLARLLRLSGDRKAAETACREALRIHEAACGKLHSNEASFLGHLALIREGQMDFAQAIQLRKDALNILLQIPDLEPVKVEQQRDRLIESSWRWVVALRSKEKWDEATQAAKQWKSLIVERRGREDWRTADAEYEIQKLQKLAGFTVEERGQVAKAEEMLERAKQVHSQGKTPTSQALAEEVSKVYLSRFGLESRESASAMLMQGVFALRLNEKDIAETCLKESDRIWTKVVGAHHPQAAEARFVLGSYYLEQGETGSAIAHYREAYERYQKCNGPANNLTKQALETLLSVHQGTAATAESQKNFKDSLIAWNKQVELAMDVLGPLHWRTAEARAHAAGASRRAALTPEQLAKLDQAYLAIAGEVADVQKAPLAHLEKIAPEIQIMVQMLGTDDLTMIEVSRAMAIVAAWGSDPVQEMHYLKEAETQAAKTLTKAHPLYAQILAELATGLLHSGSESRAMALLRSALDSRKAAMGDSKTGYAQILQRLAWAKITVGQNAEARRDFYAAAKIYSDTQGKETPDYVSCLKVLGALHRVAGEHDIAEELLREASTIAEKLTVGDYSELSRFRAMNLSDAGRWKEALIHYEKAHEQLHKRNGAQAPDTLFALRELAGAKLALGEKSQAAEMFDQVLSGYAEARTSASEFTESRLSSLAEDAKVALDAWIGLSLDAKLPAHEIYPRVLNWKGAAFDTQRRIKGSRVNKLELYPLLDELNAVNSELSAAVFSLADAGNKPNLDQELETLRARKRELERSLIRRSEASRRAQSQMSVTIKELLKAIEPGIGVIDFIVIDDPLAPGEQKLLGFLLRHNHEIILLDFGNEKVVAALVSRWRAGLGTDADSNAAASDLKTRVWDPIKKHLGDDHTVLVSPHGSLVRFPLAALPGAKPNTFLIEDGYRFAVIPSTRALPELLEAPKTKFAREQGESLLVLGGADFGADPGAPAATDEIAPQALAPISSGLRFEPLEGAKREKEAIARLFRTSTRDAGWVSELSGGLATEHALRQAAGRYRYFHLATHGFESHPRSQSEKVPSLRFDSRNGGAHPSRISGIVLAGANYRGLSGDANRDDGIMTALEVADLDFSQAQLVTLSACETGLGETTTGEGVLGMQRAFHLAGAKTCAAALWRINDQATMTFMEEYYRRLWIERERPLEALTNAQLTLLKEFHFDPHQQALVRGAGGKRQLTKTTSPGQHSNRLPPAFWAAIVLSGDWR